MANLGDVGDLFANLRVDFSGVDSDMRAAQNDILQALRGIERAVNRVGDRLGEALGAGIKGGVRPGLRDAGDQIGRSFQGIQADARAGGAQIGAALSRGISGAIGQGDALARTFSRLNGVGARFAPQFADSFGDAMRAAQVEFTGGLRRLEGTADASGQRIGDALGDGVADGLRSGIGETRAAFTQHLQAVQGVATASGGRIGDTLARSTSSALSRRGVASGQFLGDFDDATAAGTRIGTQLVSGIDVPLRDAKGRIIDRLEEGAQGGRATGQKIGKTVADGINAGLGGVGRSVEPQLRGVETAFRSTFARIAQNVRSSLGQAIEGLSQPVAQLGNAMAGLGAGRAFVDILNTAGEFESQLIRLREVAGATPQQLEAITVQARKLGAETAFSATEAAQAMNILASAGFNVDQTMQAVPGTMDLAAAAQTDLATAADISGAILNQYRLSAEKASRVNDILVATSSKTAAGLVDLGFGMKYVGPLANSLGMSVEETASALGILAQNGIKGEMAGTALRGVLSVLLDPSKEAVSIFKELGFSFKDLDVTTRGVNPVLETLGARLKHTGDISAVFGNEAQVAAGILLHQRDAINGVTTAVVDAANRGGGAAALGRANMEGWAGAIRQLGGSFETLKLAIADSGLLSGMTALVKAAADVIARLSELNPNILEFGAISLGIVATLGSVAAGVGLFATVLGAAAAPVAAVIGGIAALVAGLLTFREHLGPAVTAVQAFFRGLSTGWNGAFASLDGAIGAITRLGGAIVSAASATLAGLPQVATTVLGHFVSIFTAGIQAAVPVIGPLFGAITDAARVALDALPNIASTVTEMFKAGFVQGIGAVVGAAAGLLLNLGSTLTNSIRGAVGQMLSAWTGGMANSGWTGALGSLTRAVVAGLNALGDAAISLMGSFAKGILAGFGAAFGVDLIGPVEAGIAAVRAAVAGGFSGMKDAALEAFKALADGMLSTWTNGLQSGDWLGVLTALLQTVVAGLDTFGSAVISTVRGFATGLLSAFRAVFGVDLLGAVTTGIESLRLALAAGFSSLTTTVLGSISAMGAALLQAGQAALGGLASIVTVAIQALSLALQTGLAATGSLAVGLFGSIRDAVMAALSGLPSFVSGIAAGIGSALLGGLQTLATSVAASLATLGQSLLDGIRSAVSNMLAAWTSGLQAGDWTGGLRAAAAAILAALSNMADDALATMRAFAARLLDGFQAAFGPELIAAAQGAIGAVRTAVADGIVAMKDAALKALKALAAGLQKYLIDKLNAVAAAVAEPIEAVKNLFAGLYDAVVGNSYIPDMVDGVGMHMARLQGQMVDPAADMTGKTATHFKTLEGDVSSSIARINAELKAANGNVLFGGAGAARFATANAPTPQGLRGTAPTPPAQDGGARRVPRAWQDDAAKTDNDVKQRRERIAELKAEAAELRRLQAAQNVSEAEYERVKLAIAGERAARELGIGATKAERAAVSELAIEQEKLTAAIERQQTVRDLSQDVAGLQRIAEATKQSAAAGEEARIAVDAERAARELGALATDKERQAVIALTTQREMLSAATERNAAVRDTGQEIADLERLNTATLQGVTAREQARIALEAERTARELGLGASAQEIEQIKQQIAAREQLKQAGAFNERLVGLQMEISEQEQLNEAQRQGAAAYRATQAAIEAERAARELGLGAGAQEVEQLRQQIILREQIRQTGAFDQRVAGMQQEIADRERLNAAQLQGTAAYEQTRLAIEAERVARELGLEGRTREIEVIQQQIARMAELDRAGATQQRLASIQVEINETERLNAASLQGAQAYRQVAAAIEAERAVREAGLPPMSEEARRLADLTRQRALLRDEMQMAQTYDAGAGARAALTAYVDEANQHGRIAGEAIRAGLGIAEDGLAQFLRTGEFTFQNLEDAADRFKEMLIDIAAQQIIGALVGGMMGGFGGPGMGAGAGYRTYAKGGIPPGKGISDYSGSIVRKPTIFPFARGVGLMGEAGAEAVMPLKRGANGRLGVEADVANNNNQGVKVEIIDQRGSGAPPVEQQRTTDGNGMETIRLLIRSEMQSSIRKGDMNKAMSTQFGLQPALRK